MAALEESEFEEARRGHRPFADLEWFASDESGHIAAFVTAGFAAIPLCAFDRNLPFAALHQLIDRLSATSGALPVDQDQGRNQSFVEFAAKGLFVYDWNHAFGSYHADLPYRLMTRPDRPIHASDLGLQNSLPMIPVAFEDHLEIVVERYFSKLNL